MLPIRQMLLTNFNRPKKRIIKLKGIVMHWTANLNRGADAEANRNYFNKTSTAASAHYIVDDSQIIQCVPDDEIAYHVGAKKYTSIGEDIRNSPYSPNYYLIGIEMCVNADGIWEKTYINSVKLAAFLLNKYKLDVNSLYRHHDITGKDCPRMMISDLAWNKFKNDVAKEVSLYSGMKRPSIPRPSEINIDFKRVLKLMLPMLSGDDVKRVQGKLKELGFYLENIDGVYGQNTQNAVKKFQKSRGLQVDGIVGKKTWEELF